MRIGKQAEATPAAVLETPADVRRVLEDLEVQKQDTVQQRVELQAALDELDVVSDPLAALAAAAELGPQISALLAVERAQAARSAELVQREYALREAQRVAAADVARGEAAEAFEEVVRLVCELEEATLAYEDAEKELTHFGGGRALYNNVQCSLRTRVGNLGTVLEYFRRKYEV